MLQTVLQTLGKLSAVADAVSVSLELGPLGMPCIHQFNCVDSAKVSIKCLGRAGRGAVAGELGGCSLGAGMRPAPSPVKSPP